MRTVAVSLPDDLADEVEKLATERGISITEYLRLSVEEKLVRDEGFERAAAHVLEKNSELYRRLA